MKSIDKEIHDIERRMAYRRHEIADTARVARSRAIGRMLSPAGIAAAAALGFVATLGIMRKRHSPRVVRVKEEKGGKVAGALGLLMPVAIAIIRAQFGSPAGMAQFVLEKMNRSPRRASPRGDIRAPVHPAP
ncbi:MAG TPA: hypothetical protein VEB41_13940 [Burkholderiales bacterium]|nr:hypothetical protein [Burkholderiales bacterium]